MLTRVLLSVALLGCFSSAASALDCGDGKIRGVNLGGWLLLEPWITPGFFEQFNVGENDGLVVDEWTIAQYVDPALAMQKKEE